MVNDDDDLEKDFNLLLSCDPYAYRKDGGIVDTVQEDMLKFFYSAVQFHMEANLRSRFISAAVPDIAADLKPIIRTEAAAAFYQKLEVPYIALTLKDAKDPAIARLNIPRAGQMITDAMQASGVYQSQAKAMYELAWTKRFAGARRYLDDQRARNRSYRQKIEKLVDEFSKQALGEDADEDSVTVLKKLLEEASSEAKLGKYWAFRALLRFLSQENLDTLIPRPDNPLEPKDPNNPTRKVLRQSAVLNSLDDTGKLGKLFQEFVNVHILAKGLPKYIDYEANEAELKHVCEQLLKQFLAQTDDPKQQHKYEELRSAAQELLHTEGGRRNIDQCFTMFFAGLTSTGSVRSFDAAARAYSASLGQFYPVRAFGAKTGMGVAGMARLGGIAIGISGVVAMMQNGISWDKLTAKEKASLIVGGVDLLLLTAPQALKLVRVTLPSSFQSIVSFFKSKAAAAPSMVRSMSSAELRVVSENIGRAPSVSSAALLRTEGTAVARVESGFVRWLKEEMPGSISSSSRRAIAAAATEDSVWVRRIFGRNMDHFLATRVGLVLSLGGVALGIWGLVEAKGTKEIVLNSVLTAAAVMEVFSIATGMLAADAVGGVGLALGRVGSVLGPVGMALSIGVAVYMIIDSFIPGQPSPTIIAQFVEKDAKAAGLYMPHGMDIDYLASTGSNSAGNGVTVALGATSEKLLCLDLPGRDATVSSLLTNFDADTVFDLTVDGSGRVTVISRGFSQDAGTHTGESEREAVAVVLAVEGSAGKAQRVVALQYQQGSKKSAQVDLSALWQAVMVGAGEKDKNGHPVSGPFSLQSCQTSTYLAAENDKVVLSDKPFSWKVTTGVPIRPRFSYHTESFVLGRSTELKPDIDQMGRGPITWTSRNLPQFLSLGDGGVLKVDDEKLAEQKGSERHFNFQVTATNDAGFYSYNVTIQRPS